LRHSSHGDKGTTISFDDYVRILDSVQNFVIVPSKIIVIFHDVKPSFFRETYWNTGLRADRIHLRMPYQTVSLKSLLPKERPQELGEHFPGSKVTLTTRKLPPAPSGGQAQGRPSGLCCS
jgi:hypothetical protein